jgi:hypothetical protein
MQPEINTLDLCVVEERQECKRSRTEQMGVAVIPWTFTANVPVLYLGWDIGHPDFDFSWFYSSHPSKFPNISMIKLRLISFASFPMLDLSLTLLFEIYMSPIPKA